MNWNAWSRVRRVLDGILGGDRYQKYLAHHARTGCEHPPMTEKQYWQDYYRHQEQNPGARCC